MSKMANQIHHQKTDSDCNIDNVAYVMDYGHLDPNDMTKSDMIDEICGLPKCVATLKNKEEHKIEKNTELLEKDKIIKRLKSQLNGLYPRYLSTAKDLEKERSEHHKTKMILQHEKQKYDNMNSSFTHNVRLCVAQEYPHLLAQINDLSEKVRTLEANLNQVQKQDEKKKQAGDAT